jgi:hypothetical protein
VGSRNFQSRSVPIRAPADWPVQSITPDPTGERDFPATLLAMAGHDLRQPLRITTGAHDVLAYSLQDYEQREELALAEESFPCEERARSRPDMTVVEVRCSVSELGAVMTEMRSWLDHHELAPSQFELVSNADGVLDLRVHFLDVQQAVAFANAFAGGVLGEPYRPAA